MRTAVTAIENVPGESTLGKRVKHRDTLGWVKSLCCDLKDR